MRVGSLFAGIGGFDLAAERAGMTVAWQSENDPHASTVLNHRFPGVPNYGDIHNIRDSGWTRTLETSERTWHQSRDGLHIGSDRSASRGSSRTGLSNGQSPPAVDVLCGGFPCQDYSVAGNRGGLAGDRGALWWEYHRLITGLRPTWVVAENVPGLLSSRDGQDFETIISSLTELGYGVAWAVLDAQYFGVAQRRRRVFIVGHSRGVPRPEVLALAEGLYGHPAPSRTTGTSVAPTLAARTRGGGGLGTDTELDGGLIAGALDTRPGDRHRPEGLVGFKHKAGAKAGTVGASYSLSPSLQAEQTVAVAFDGDVTHTLRGEAGPEGIPALLPTVRRLTPLECERLQGFPDHWTNIKDNSDTQRYRQLGNAVAVPVVEWIMRNIADAD